MTLISVYKYSALAKTIFWEFKLQFSAVLLFLPELRGLLGTARSPFDVLGRNRLCFAIALIKCCGKAKVGVTETVLSKQLMLISISSLTTIQLIVGTMEIFCGKKHHIQKDCKQTNKCFKKTKMTKANKITKT